ASLIPRASSGSHKPPARSTFGAKKTLASGSLRRSAASRLCMSPKVLRVVAEEPASHSKHRPTVCRSEYQRIDGYQPGGSRRGFFPLNKPSHHNAVSFAPCPISPLMTAHSCGGVVDQVRIPKQIWNTVLE